MPILLVTSTGAQSSTNTGVTTAAIDTTGATLLVLAIGYYNPAGTGTISDSKGNTWVALTAYATANSSSVRIYHCKNPIVGAGHTFTVSGVTNYPSIAVEAFSGTDQTAYANQENGATALAATVQPGSLTPAVADEVVICAESGEGTVIPTIDSGFTRTSGLAFSGGLAYGIGLAYKVQTTAAAENPTWTIDTVAKYASATITCFKAGAEVPTGSGVVLLESGGAILLEDGTYLLKE